MRRIVMFSGGVASWAAARRVADRYGTQDMTLLFTDTKAEDPDLYRFLKEASANVGAPLVRIVEGRDPKQVFRDEKFLGNHRIAPCSRILKQEPARKWLRENCDSAATVLYLGMDWTEGDRHEGAIRGHAPFPVEFPLDWRPCLTKPACVSLCLEAGLILPRLYRWATNNNCAGLCVRGGQGHWARVLANDPKGFTEMELFEEEMRAELGDIAILDERPGGNRVPLPLRVLRERLQGRAPGQVDLFDIGACACYANDEAAPMTAPEAPARAVGL